MTTFILILDIVMDGFYPPRKNAKRFTHDPIGHSPFTMQLESLKRSLISTVHRISYTALMKFAPTLSFCLLIA